jgi:hypothetical protein
MDIVEINKVENIWSCNGRGVIKRMRDIENATDNVVQFSRAAYRYAIFLADQKCDGHLHTAKLRSAFFGAK